MVEIFSYFRFCFCLLLPTRMLVLLFCACAAETLHLSGSAFPLQKSLIPRTPSSELPQLAELLFKTRDKLYICN
jgi:hypothetical protein